nr:hypothetical protein [uncultured Catonella sp.]
MGKIIVCCGKLADNPYIVEETGKKLYSIEEICHYVRTNIYSIDLGFFSPMLINFIKEELNLPMVAKKLKSLIVGNYLLNDVITTLFCSCDLYSKEEILEIIELVKYLAQMPAWERRAYIGYKKLEERKFLVALKYFRGTLKEENLAEKDYGIVLRAMGICLIHVSSFKEAAECFYKSHKHTGSKETLIFALLALKLGNPDKEFNDRVNEFTKDETVISEAERIWKEAEKNALNGENIKNIDNIFDKLKTDKVAEGYKETELKLEEFKTGYREGAWNGLVS